jgi:hypothetical protein
MVFAKTPEALSGLKDLFSEHSLHRIYKAILVGELPENIGTLHDKVVERTRSLKMAVVARRTGGPKPEGAKPAVTHYRVIERLPGHTVVELRLETGRRNQIRVQFSERGYPILGDQIYGSATPLIDRQALHAEILGLRHPVLDENIEIHSELPEDMEMALKRLRVARRVHRAKEGLKGEEGMFKPRYVKDRKQERVMEEQNYSKEKFSRDADRAHAPKRPQRTDGRFEKDFSKPRDKGFGEKYAKPRPARPRSEEYASRSDADRAPKRPPRATGREENEYPRERTSRDADRAHAPNRPQRATGRYESDSSKPRENRFTDKIAKPRPARPRSEEPASRSTASKPLREGRRAYVKRDGDSDFPKPKTSRQHYSKDEAFGASGKTKRYEREEKGRSSGTSRPRSDRFSKSADAPKPRRDGRNEYKKAESAPRGQKSEQRPNSFASKKPAATRKTSGAAEKKYPPKFDKTSPRPPRRDAKPKSAPQRPIRAPKRKT